jgi:hypothetical protein
MAGIETKTPTIVIATSILTTSCNSFLLKPTNTNTNTRKMGAINTEASHTKNGYL